MTEKATINFLTKRLKRAEAARDAMLAGLQEIEADLRLRAFAGTIRHDQVHPLLDHIRGMIAVAEADDDQAA